MIHWIDVELSSSRLTPGASSSSSTFGKTILSLFKEGHSWYWTGRYKTERCYFLLFYYWAQVRWECWVTDWLYLSIIIGLTFFPGSLARWSSVTLRTEVSIASHLTHLDQPAVEAGHLLSASEQDSLSASQPSPVKHKAHLSSLKRLLEIATL